MPRCWVGIQVRGKRGRRRGGSRGGSSWSHDHGVSDYSSGFSYYNRHHGRHHADDGSCMTGSDDDSSGADLCRQSYLR